MGKLFDRMIDKYGFMAALCVAMCIFMLAAIGIFLTLLTKGLFLLIFPIAAVYMGWQTYKDMKKK